MPEYGHFYDLDGNNSGGDSGKGFVSIYKNLNAYIFIFYTNRYYNCSNKLIRL